MDDKSSILEFKLGAGDAGRPVENILRSKFGFSRGLIRKLKRRQGVYINDRLARLKDTGNENDTVKVVLREVEESWITPRELPLRVVYEDEDLLVIDKEAGMLVHPVSFADGGTVANAVLYRWARQGIAARFRPVYRLDRNTSGLLAIAKNSFANHVLVKQMKEHKIRRRYLAVAHGKMGVESGVIDYPIAPEPGSGGRRYVNIGGKAACTRFWVLEQFDSAALLLLELGTGRTHQIRVHLSAYGHPLLGDVLYGGDDSIISRQALHSYQITFLKPRTGASVKLASPLPGDMVQLLEQLGRGRCLGLNNLYDDVDEQGQG